MSTSDLKLYICPTYHPAGERNLKLLSENYEIHYYNFHQNNRDCPTQTPYDFVDLALPKATIQFFDFAITNTVPLANIVLKKRPAEIVTEDYLFALPYIVAAKFTKTRLVYYNSNTSPSATRVKKTWS